jgi:hypothetical protein
MGCLKVEPVTEKIRSNCLAWCRHVMLRNESHITKNVMSMNVKWHPRSGRPKKRWMTCVKDDMRIKGVSMVMMNDGIE